MPKLYNAKYFNEKTLKKNYTTKLDDFINEKRNQLFSLIDIDEKEEKKLKLNESELENIKKENNELKNLFDESVKACQQKQKYLFEFRNVEDDLLRKKREREDEKLYSEQSEIFYNLEKLFQNLAPQRKIKDISLKNNIAKNI